MTKLEIYDRGYVHGLRAARANYELFVNRHSWPNYRPPAERVANNVDPIEDRLLIRRLAELKAMPRRRIHD